MTCSAYEYSPDGRRGIGVNQPQSGLDYPLVTASPDIQYLLADFYLAYESGVAAPVGALSIKWLYGLGCAPVAAPVWAPTSTHTADILIVDSAGTTVFNSTANNISFSTWCWGLKKDSTACTAAYDYKVYEWQSSNIVCRIVAYQTWPTSAAGLDETAARHYATNITPEAAVLDSRTVYRVPRRVKSIVLPGYSNNTDLKITATSVDVAAGLNTILAASDAQNRGLRATRQVTISAVAGAGLGKYVDCAETQPVIRSLNGISGPNLLIAANDCLWSYLPTTYNSNTNKLTPQRVSNTATQKIGSNCPACCTCADYVDIATYMNNTRNRYKTIGNDAGAVLLLHSNNISRWQSQRECRIQKPLKICMTAQRCPYIDVVAQYCNNCTDCAHNVTLKLDFVAYPANTAAPVCSYSMITTAASNQGLFNLEGTWPSFTAKLGDVDAGNAAAVSFRLAFADAQATTVNATVTATSDEGPILAGCVATDANAVATISKALYCDNAGNTVTLC